MFDPSRQSNKLSFDKKQKDIQLFDEQTGKMDQSKLIVAAKYEKKDNIYIESEYPSEENYMGIGFDSKTDKINGTSKKYYRYFVNEELEK